MYNVRYALLLAVFLAACTAPETPEASEQGEGGDSASVAELQVVFNDYREYVLRTSPETADYEGDHRYSDRLSDYSAAAAAKGYDSLRIYLARLRSIPRNNIAGSDLVNYDMFERSIQEQLSFEEFHGYMMPLTQQSGLHIDFPQIIEYQPFDSAGDYARYFMRLRAFPGAVGHVIANMREGIAAGVVQPRFVVEQIIAQTENIGAMDPNDTPFMVPLLRDDTGLTEDEQIRLSAELVSLIGVFVQPAYKKLTDFLRDEYLPAARTEPGVWSLPDGIKRYNHMIRWHTTTNMTADEIFETGQSEVARIRKEMERLVREDIGFEGDLAAFMKYARTDERFYYKDKDSLMAGYRRILDNMDAKLPQLFGVLPQAPYELKEMEAYRARSAPQAYYYQAPEDRSRPGYFYVNTYDLPSRPTYTMTALALHEAVPGHHLQIAIAQELDDLPWFRRQLGFTAFVEGWGLYAEYLGYETGMYEDVYQHFGALTFEMWRACRLVVDAGLHAKQWDREQAVQFMLANTPNSELDLRSEVDRYIVWPGQALAYKVGELKLKELRARAEQALGNSFDVRNFHDEVLGAGALPLTLLEQRIDDWIAAQQSKG